MPTTWNIHQDENLKKKINEYDMEMTQMLKKLPAASTSLKISYQVWFFLINTFVGMKQQSLTLMCNNLNIITMYYQNLTSN